MLTMGEIVIILQLFYTMSLYLCTFLLPGCTEAGLIAQVVLAVVNNSFSPQM